MRTIESLKSAITLSLAEVQSLLHEINQANLLEDSILIDHNARQIRLVAETIQHDAYELRWLLRHDAHEQSRIGAQS